jgi:hypothetical protein
MIAQPNVFGTMPLESGAKRLPHQTNENNEAAAITFAL